MAGLDPGIHVLASTALDGKSWIPGSSPGMMAYRMVSP